MTGPGKNGRWGCSRGWSSFRGRVTRSRGPRVPVLRGLRNNALEQTAATSRSWHRRQEVDSKGLARQERSVPPLLTAGVRKASR
jgi:hypothetical protein